MIAATEEERFRRVKHWAGFPSMAIQFCLREAGITLNEVDHICIGRDPMAKLQKKMMFLLKNPGVRMECRAGSFKKCTQSCEP
jgi:carbamoyltransferase